MLELAESRIYEFEEFRLEAKSHRLFRRAGGELVPLTPKAVDLLLFFVRNAGRVLSKDELLDAVWENSFVEEANISQTIFVLRKTLGENTKEPRFILTVPNRGYQFIAPVREIDPQDSILEESFLAEEISPEIENPTPTTQNRKSKIENQKSAFFAAAAVLIIAAIGVYWFYPAAKPVSVREIKTIAILPFEDLSTEQTDKYLGVGLADALANKFGGLKQITVRPTRAVLKYAENREDAGKIGRELQVDAVLDGRIQRVGEQIRVSVQLIRTSDNATLWTEKFDDRFTNFFAVQDSISQRVLQSLAVRLDEKEREIFNRRGTQNAAAYQDYLRGQFFWNKRTADNLQKAIEHFEASIAKDSNFALAYTGLSNSYQLLAEYGAAAPHDVFPKARAAARRALEIDERSAEAHTALAYTQAFYDWDWTGAEQSFQRALELNPNYATAHQWFAEYLVVTGRFDEARRHLERALEIEPVSPIILADLAALYDQTNQPDEEIAQALKVIEIDPNFAYGHFYLGLGYERKGMNREASEALAKAMTLFGEPAECADEVQAAFAKNGMAGWWQKRLEQIETRPHLRNFQAYHKALVRIRLGDKEGALESLDRAFERKDRLIINAKHEPRLDSLRQDARFQNLLRRLGL
jgi:DNA-binding winged helix-turn-helix (wHTH) protein/TolB-like protein